MTPLGASILPPDGDTFTMLYHHGDIVSRLPPCAALLGCSATNPSHAFAVFSAATAARTAVTRASASANTIPQGLTYQAHPEFSTPTGRRVLGALLADESETRAPVMTRVAVAERL